MVRFSLSPKITLRKEKMRKNLNLNLNLAKIVCFAKWVKGAKCVSSDFLNEKALMILTCIILKIKAQLNQLWITLFYAEQSVEF